MIRTFKKLRGGQYIADFRYDEGIRIREEFVSPTLVSSQRTNDIDGLSNRIYLITIEDGKTDTDIGGKE